MPGAPAGDAVEPLARAFELTLLAETQVCGITRTGAGNAMLSVLCAPIAVITTGAIEPWDSSTMLRTSDDRVDRGNDAPDLSEIAPAYGPCYPRHGGLKVGLVDEFVPPVDYDGELFP